jgi:hypothetical protein
MYRNGRPVISAFEPDELLYIRVSPEKIEGGMVADSALRLPDQSANRSRLSAPQWVLLPDWSTWRVASVTVAQVERLVFEPAEADPYDASPVHEPEDMNYSHSVIAIWRSNERLPQINNRKHRKQLRVLLAGMLELQPSGHE